MKPDIDEYNEILKDKDPGEVLKFFLEKHWDKMALSSSLGAEDQVLTDMMMKIMPCAKVFTLDTGRLPKETYDVICETMKKYDMKYTVYFPKTAEVEKMESEDGPNLFYESVDKRKQCCSVRKIKPLKRALSGLSVWITGLRKEQSITRAEVNIVEWDETFGIIKVNPLVFWTEKQVWDYIKSEKVPYNKLHDKGFPSIGCAPCTRAVKEGEDIRAGRWWWENPEDKECGLHIKNGKVVRNKADS